MRAPALTDCAGMMVSSDIIETIRYPQKRIYSRAALYRMARDTEIPAIEWARIAALSGYRMTGEWCEQYNAPEIVMA